MSKYLKLLSQYLRPLRTRMVILALCFVIGTSLQLILPQLLREFVDKTTSETVQYLIIVAVLYASVAFLHKLLDSLTLYLSEGISWSATNAIRQDLTEHCLGMDIEFHNTVAPGELVERIDGDVSTLANFLSVLCLKVTGSVLLLTGIVVILLVENWFLGLSVLFFMLVVIAVLGYLRDIGVVPWNEARQVSADLMSFVEERFTAREDISANGAVGFVIDRLEKLQELALRSFRRAHTRGNLPFILTGTLFILGDALALFIGLNLYRENLITVGTILMVLYYLALTNGPLFTLSEQSRDLQTVGASVARINDILGRERRIKEGSKHLPCDAANSVEFEDVTFRYGEDLVLDHVSFFVEEGQTLGVLGRTGSGKTTIGHLLMRFYDPNLGRVRIGGQDIKTIRKNDLNARVGLVTQDIQLFHASLRDNLTFFNEAIADDTIADTLDQVGMGDWFRSLPDGLDTVLQDRNANLSAGESQLIAIVRLFLKNPRIVILDEVSAKLDLTTEQRLRNALEKVLRGRTGIVITHRIETIRGVDIVLILEEGKVCEAGSAEDLLLDDTSHFSQMLHGKDGKSLS